MILLLILCSVPLIIVILMCAMLRNFDFLERIIGLNLENNQKVFQEVRDRIFGKILSTIASSLISGGGGGEANAPPFSPLKCTPVR